MVRQSSRAVVTMGADTFLYYVFCFVSLLSLAFTQRNCPPGRFCQIGANCINDTNFCVTRCPTDFDREQQGNHLTGNCERLPNGTKHWMDSTLYEVFILSNQTLNTPILIISFISTDEFQTNDFTFTNLITDITFTLIGSCPYFYFTNMLKKEVAFENYYDFYGRIESVSLALAEPVPLDDYEMEVTVTDGGNILQRRVIIVHVRDAPPCTTGPETFVDFSSSNFTVLKSSGRVVVTLVSLKALSQSFIVGIIAEADNSSGFPPATASENFIPVRHNATFSTGDTTATSSIPIIAGGNDEDIEQISLRLFINGDVYQRCIFLGNVYTATVFVIPVPNLVATQTTIHALLGENVSVNCIPSDSNLELQWVICTSTDLAIIPPMINEVILPGKCSSVEPGSGLGSGEGSGVVENGGSKFDDEGSAEMVIPHSNLQTRLQYQLPIHQLTLVNTSLTDNGYFMCQIKLSPDDDINISQRITLNIFTNVINIGYSPNSLIPENNVINLMAIKEKKFISCFTTQKYENPVWMISSNNFSTGLLINNGTIMESFRGSNFTIKIVKISLYQSDISIDTNGVDFTGNLTCLSQDNPQTQYSVIITTNDIYVQLLSPNPILVEFFQRFSLTFLVAQMSNGISNEIPGARYIVRSPTGPLRFANTLENSTQIFVLDLGIATQETVGNYTIPYRGNDDIIVEVILQSPTITTVNPNIGILNGENVTFVCVPSDLDIEIFWTYETKDGSRGTVTVANVSESRFLSHSPLLHRLVLSNATYGDAGIYRCIPQGPIGEVVSETITLNVLSNVVNIGDSPNSLIPDNNVINLPSEGSQHHVNLSCYTTQGYENPVWMISSNNFSSRILKESGTLPGGGNITVIRRSLYQSEILVEISNAEFTGNLICHSQNNTKVQYTVVITTSSFYVQPLSPIPIMVRYLQPINLTFRVAWDSNGTFNGIERLTVFQYDSNSNAVGKKLAETLEGSTQIFVLNLGQAEPSTSGSYLIVFMDGKRFRNATVGIIDAVVVEETCSITMIRGRFRHNQNRKRTTFRFSSDGDPKAKYKCKLDDKKFIDCKSPMIWRNLRRGRHTVTVRAFCTDDEGNILTTTRRKFNFRIR